MPDKKSMMLAIGIGAEKPEVSFDVPEGVDLTDIKDGEEKEVVAVIRKEADGKACLVSINGIELSKEEEPEEEVEEEEVEETPEEAPEEASVKGRAASVGLM